SSAPTKPNHESPKKNRNPQTAATTIPSRNARCLNMPPWTKQSEDADERPSGFEHHKADLKWMESDVSQHPRTRSIEDVVRGGARVHPFHLVAGVSDQNKHGPNEGPRLQEGGHVHGKLL